MTGYSEIFTSEDFTQDAESGKFIMTKTSEDIALGGGTGIRLSKLLRQSTGGKYENVIAAYDVALNGDLHIYSDEVFNGMLVITSDE